MDNLPQIKVFDVDYSFIIRNYLDPKLWEKKWTLLVYKSFVFTLELNYIYTYNSKIVFSVCLEDTLNKKDYETKGYYTTYDNSQASETVSYSLKVDNLNILKKQINTAMLDCIKRLEKNKVRASQTYMEIDNSSDDEERILRGIAEDFLDSEGVSNSDIRDAYIEIYVGNNKKIENKLSNYIDSREYLELTDLYLLFAKVTNSDNLALKVENAVDDEDLINEITEYINKIYTDEYEDEMKDYLESI